MQLNTFKDWLNDDKWINQYNICIEYEKEFNNTITYNTKYKDINIGSFIARQKKRYKGNDKHKKIEENELQLLMKMNTFIHWLNDEKSFINNDEKWMYIFHLCVEYENIYNNNITHTTRYKDINIGQFIDTQKRSYKGKNGPRRLNENELQLMMQLNRFKDWLNDDKTFLSNDEKWINKYNLCIEYEKIYNKNILKRTKYKDVNIGMFIDKQKRTYRGIDGTRKLKENELRLLMQVNTFKDWLNGDKKFYNNDEKWMHNYNFCVEYEKEFITNIRHTTKYKDINIGGFIKTQKSRYKGDIKKGRKLEDNQLQLLMQLNTFKDWVNK